MTSITNEPCPHCGMKHVETCPRIKAIEYHPDGSIKRIEFLEPQSITAGSDYPLSQTKA